jgi:hypothetical protein
VFHTADIEADHAILRAASVNADAEIARKGKHRSGLVSLDVTINASGDHHAPADAKARLRVLQTTKEHHEAGLRGAWRRVARDPGLRLPGRVL